MFSFFKKKEQTQNITFNYESVVVDMHSHVLPGIDDGAQTPQESVALIKKMMGLGIRKIIATPHVMADYYRNTPETISNALELLKAELKQQQIEILIETAAEHYFDETFPARVEDGRLMTMGDNYVLFEYSFISPPPVAVTTIQRMIALGYKPILAHPERYTYMDTEAMSSLRAMGCNLQLNTVSLTGYYGKDIKKKAESMIDLQLVDFISSDMHHLKQAAALRDALTAPYLKQLLFDYPLKNIMLK